MKYLKIYLIVITVALIVLAIGNWIYHLPTKITISSDQWDCSMPEANGIETFCSNYTMKRSVREKLSTLAPLR
jgi:hypothetical protein